MESFASSISLQQVQRHHIRDTRYRKTACDIADPLDLLNIEGMEISKSSWEPMKLKIFLENNYYNIGKNFYYKNYNEYYVNKIKL